MGMLALKKILREVKGWGGWEETKYESKDLRGI